MAEQENFSTMFSNFIKEVKEKEGDNKLNEVMGKSVTDIIEYALSSPELENNFKIHLEKFEKIADRARFFRMQGIDLYKEGNYVEALKSFNESVTLSEWSNSDDNLSLVYSNRSSLAFELELYQECLMDISRAMENGHPLRFRPKLVARQAKCYLALGKATEAISVLDECIQTLDVPKLDGPKIKETITTLNELKDRCSEGSPRKKENEVLNAKFFTVQPVEIPIIEHQHPDIPNLSSAVDLIYTDERGRHLIAERDIEPGELIICAKNYCSIVVPPNEHTHCTYCLMRTYFPVPCPVCTTVVFCSENCRSLALDSFHAVECKIIPTANKIELMHRLLPFRMLFKVGINHLWKNYSKWKKEFAYNTDFRKLGFNHDSIFNSFDYRTIYNMKLDIGNKFNRMELMSTAASSFILLKLVEETSYLSKQSNIRKRRLVFKTFFNHYLLLSINSGITSIKELAMKDNNTDEVCLIGYGVSSLFSFLSPSCAPSTGRFFFGSTIASRAVNFIPKGSEITDDFGRLYSHLSIERRQASFHEQFKIECICRACIERWPMTTELPAVIRTICTKCTLLIVRSGRDVLLGKNTCQNCTIGFKVGTKSYKQMMQKNGENTIILNKLIALASKMITYCDRRVFLEDYELNKVKYFITLLCKHTVQPSKVLETALLLLVQYYDLKSSRFYQPNTN